MTVGKLYSYLSKRLADRSLSCTYLKDLSALSFGVLYNLRYSAIGSGIVFVDIVTLEIENIVKTCVIACSLPIECKIVKIEDTLSGICIVRKIKLSEIFLIVGKCYVSSRITWIDKRYLYSTTSPRSITYSTERVRISYGNFTIIYYNLTTPAPFAFDCFHITFE